MDSSTPDQAQAERARRAHRTRELQMEALRTAASAIYGESERLEREDDTPSARRLARRLDRLADQLARRATRLYLKQHADTPIECACGTKLADLRAFFGPDLDGHIITCATCGARQWHTEEDRGECLACGAWSAMDAEGSIVRGNRRTGEREMVRDVNAERERYFASQS